MKYTFTESTRPKLLILFFITLFAITGLLQAQVLFSFSVNDLEAYSRDGNWIYDADSPGMPTHDGNWFTEGSPPQWKYYAEQYVHEGVGTIITCDIENVDLATDPALLSLSLTEFDLVSFQRVNTVNPLAPWNIPGQSGDERVYANATGTIAYDGTDLLFFTDATFVITTPYPTQAQVIALSPFLAGWTGDIGTGAPQTGYGFATLDQVNSDPAWLALFAASDYKVDMQMLNIVSVATPTTGLFDFTLTMEPAVVPVLGLNIVADLGSLPLSFNLPSLSSGFTINAGVPGGSGSNMNNFYLKEIGQAPLGAIPGGYSFTTNKHWKLGSTAKSFLLNLYFELDMGDFAKAPADWAVIYRPNEASPWSLWPDTSLMAPNRIYANGVTQSGFFAVVSTLDETLPVELSSFSATLSGNSTALIKWTTASETDMSGFKVYANTSDLASTALCLTPSSIAATNSAIGAQYSFSATEIAEPGIHYFWLEALSLSGHSEFYGPVTLNIPGEPQIPELPERNYLGTAFPNPFKTGDNTSIEVDIKAGEQGTLSIYNISGQLVKSYSLNSGSRIVDWDGRDSKGAACASGIYYYRLSSSGYNQARKLVILK